MKKLKINIEGMHCKSCVELVKDPLLDTGAVKRIKVSMGRAAMEYDNKKINESKIAQIIENNGFKVKK